MSVFFLNRLGQRTEQPITRRLVIAAIIRREDSTPTGGAANMSVQDTHGDEHLLTADEFSPPAWRNIRVGTILEMEVLEHVHIWSGPHVVA